MDYEILTNENLSDKEKLLYSLILFFSKNDNYFIVSNKYLALLINLFDTWVSKLASSLSNKKYNNYKYLSREYTKEFFESFYWKITI